MAYKLNKPYTEQQRMNFIVEYNHNLGLKIAEGSLFLCALEDWEKLVNDEIINNKEEWEAEQAQKEKEYIKNLTMTKRVFALGLQKLGITYSQLKELISTNEQAQLEWDLCVELQRKNPLIDALANSIGISSEQIDEIFVQANKEVQDALV